MSKIGERNSKFLVGAAQRKKGVCLRWSHDRGIPLPPNGKGESKALVVTGYGAAALGANLDSLPDSAGDGV